MKVFKKLLTLCAVLSLLCACALAEPAAVEDPILATVNDVEIRASEAGYYSYLLYYYGRTQNFPDYEAGLDYLIRQAVIENHLRQGGYTDFDEETMIALRNEAAVSWEQELDAYVEEYLTEDTEEQRATLREQAAVYYASHDYSMQTILDNLVLQAAEDVLIEELRGGYEPSESEISEVFATYGAMHQELYENDVALYDENVLRYGDESFYVPAGYRGVTHILLKDVDADLLNAFNSAQALYEEALSGETVDEAAVAAAKAELDAARDAVIASKQDTLDEIYARLEAGESFESLIAEYGEDPGMEDAENLANGYPVHQRSGWCVPAFVEGAFQEGMRQPGDVSQPVVSPYGIHVVYYLRDVPSGLIMTEAIREEIREYLSEVNFQNAYQAAYSDWEQEVVIVRDEEAISVLVETMAQ